MKARAAKFVAAIIASVLSSANLIAAPDNAEQAADKCLTSPGDKTPSGGHWRYRLERGTGRQCWYLKGDSEKAARKAPEETTAAADEPAPAARPAIAVTDGSQPSSARDANMMAPAAATRWPDPMSTANSGANAPAT